MQQIVFSDSAKKISPGGACPGPPLGHSCLCAPSPKYFKPLPKYNNWHIWHMFSIFSVPFHHLKVPLETGAPPVFGWFLRPCCIVMSLGSRSPEKGIKKENISQDLLHFHSLRHPIYFLSSHKVFRCPRDMRAFLALVEDSENFLCFWPIVSENENC